jgi:hypothetical protein
MRLKTGTTGHMQMLIPLVLICLLGLGESSVFAENRVCQVLEAQLRAVSTGNTGGNSRRFEKFDRAVQQQNLQIRKTERVWEGNGCSYRQSSVCNRVTTSLRQMMSNLGKLKAERARLSSGGGGISEWNRILSELRRYGCAAGYQNQRARFEPAPSRGRTILEQIFGTRTYSDDGAYGNYNSELNWRFGTFRTLCVRTCDGYYFPISFSTVENRFEQDLAQCEQMCPGADVRLFFHPMPNGDAETAISYLDKQPYSELSNAFAYRKAIYPDCNCKSDDSNFQQIAGTERDFSEQMEKRAKTGKQQMAAPSPSIDFGLSATQAENLNGGLSVAAIRSLLGGSDENTVNMGQKTKIRIVGPVYFPVQ